MLGLIELPFTLLALVVRLLCLEPFSVPSGSMLPTLQIGDYVMVSKLAYSQTRPPRRGDVAVFHLMRGGTRTDYLKRIVGLPGDRVQMRQGELYINGRKAARRQIGDISAGEFGTLHEYVETLPRGAGEAGFDHAIAKAGNLGPLDTTPVFEVPPDHYFVLGDNRDNSLDSRVMSGVGYVPAENLVGRVQFVYFSQDHGAIRFERILKAVR